MRASFDEFVGCYGFVITDQTLAFIEQQFVDPAPPNERDGIRDEAIREAAGAELEITATGCVISRSHDTEFYRVQLEPFVDARDELRFEKPSPHPAWVRLELLDRDTLIAEQPG